MKNGIVVDIFIFLLMVVLLSICGGCSGEKGKAAGVQSAGYAPVNVRIDAVLRDTIRDKIRLIGTAEPFKEVVVSSESGGEIEGLFFEKGDRVGKGRLLARVNTSLLRARFDEAKAFYDQKKAEKERLEKLFEKKAATKHQLINGTADFEMAGARLEQASILLERSEIRAPLAGVVTSKELEEGELAAPGAPLGTIQDLSRMKVTAGVPEGDIGEIRRTTPVSVTFDAFPGKTYEGEIGYISASSDALNGTFPVEVVIENPDLAVRSGMMARLEIVKNVIEEALVVRQDAVIEREDGHYAFVLEGEKARRRKLELGHVEGNRVEILSGLSPGERLVTSGQRQLADGQRVRIVTNESGK